MNMRKLLLAAALCTSHSAMAATDTADFDVTLEITGACSIAADDLDFGSNSGAIVGAIDQTSTVTVTCTNGVPYTVGFNKGIGTGGSIADRKMDHESDATTVDYNLYTDAGRTTVWDDATTNYASGTGNGAGQDITVYGRVAAAQATVTIGTYTDTITATLTY